MKNTIADNKDASPELANELQRIQDRCLLPGLFWFKTFYFLLLVGSLVPYFVHSMVCEELSWDSLRIGHGLLPVMVLMMRNSLIPASLPVIVLLSGLLSMRYRIMQTPAFLAWLTFLVLFLVLINLFVSGMFANHLASMMNLY